MDSAGVDEQKSVWSVSNPIQIEDSKAGFKIGFVVKYTVTGYDSEGQFEVQRRYNEFLALNEQLNQRWPGIYVPAIPEKQFVGDKDEEFIEERRQLLERFVQECAKYEFLIESKEFKIFTRTQGEVTELLEKLERPGPAQILEKFRLNFPNVPIDVPSQTLAMYR